MAFPARDHIWEGVSARPTFRPLFPDEVGDDLWGRVQQLHDHATGGTTVRSMTHTV